MLQLPDSVKKNIRSLVFRMNKSQHCIYLTFDDGPQPEITPLILDILDKYECKATFFCIGKNVEKYPEIFQDLKDRGHAIGNHTHNHLKGFTTSTKDYIHNVQKANKLINSHFFRPPYGRIRPKQIRILKKKYKLIMWDYITYDYDKSIEPERIFNEIKKLTRNGSIIVFHDSLKAKKNVLDVLPRALEFWKKENYDFKTFE